MTIVDPSPLRFAGTSFGFSNGSCVTSVLFLFDDAAFAFEFGDEFGLGGEDGAVFGGEELFAAFEDRKR